MSGLCLPGKRWRPLGSSCVRQLDPQRQLAGDFWRCEVFDVRRLATLRRRWRFEAVHTIGEAQLQLLILVMMLLQLGIATSLVFPTLVMVADWSRVVSTSCDKFGSLIF